MKLQQAVVSLSSHFIISMAFSYLEWKTTQVSECRSTVSLRMWANPTHCLPTDWAKQQSTDHPKKCLLFHTIEMVTFFLTRKGDLCKSFAFDSSVFVDRKKTLSYFFHRTDLADYRWIRFQRKWKKQFKVHDFFVENAFHVHRVGSVSQESSVISVVPFFFSSVSLIYHIEMLNKCRWITHGIVLCLYMFSFMLKTVGPINHIQLEHSPDFSQFSQNSFHFFDKISRLKKLCVRIWALYHVCNSVCWLQIEIYTQNQQTIYLHWSKIERRKN